MNNTISIIVGIGLLAFSIYKIYEFIKFQRRKSASETWPVIPAQVTDKQVTVHHSSRGGNTFIPKVSYKYTVMGQAYEKSINLAGIYSRDSAQKTLDDFGPTIELRYDPNNPKEHITVHEKVRVGDVLLILFALAIGLFSLIPLILK